MYDYQKQQELKKARRNDARNTLKKYSTGKNKGLAKDTIKDAKNMVQSMTPVGFLATIFQANLLSDWMYALALFAALFKDLIDFIEVSGILYGVVIVITFLISIFIAMMMLLGMFYNKSEGTQRINNTQRKIIRSWLVLMGGTTAEMLFGINILPIETLTVLIIYFFVLSERRAAKKSEEQARYLGKAQESAA